MGAVDEKWGSTISRNTSFKQKPPQSKCFLSPFDLFSLELINFTVSQQNTLFSLRCITFHKIVAVCWKINNTFPFEHGFINIKTFCD